MFLSSIPVVTPSMLNDNHLVSEVAREGIFYFEIPDECTQHVDDALKFSYQFPKDEKIKQYTDGKFGGYHRRELDQIESFYVERKDWVRVLPTSLQQLAVKMDKLSKAILKAVLVSSDIPEKLWKEGTGFLTEGGGQNHVSFNHYRPEVNGDGIKSHRDFGFVSILFVEKAGLEALYKGEWKAVPPFKNHFVVVLGRAFEILVNDISKVSASWHRVRQLSEERVSWAISCDNEGDSPVARYLKDEGKLEIVHNSYQDYLANCFKELYSHEGSAEN